ncbi:MAG TPA: O-antigen ligase family protein, partial [Candidatus Binatia bacterium]|nr:O-antigen ligase family protein [Candidatus Binatia bacterium]
LVGVVLLAVLRPLQAVYLALLLIPLESLSARFGRGTLGISATEGVALIAMGGWTLHRLLKGGPRLQSPLAAPLVLLLVAHIPGLFLAAAPFAVVKELVMWSAFFVLFLAVVSAEPGSSLRLVKAIAVSGVLVAAVAVEKTGGKPQAVSDLGGFVNGRATGSFSSPVLLGIFLAITLPLQLLFVFRGSSRWSRIAGLAAVALTLLALALTMTRSAFLAVAAATAWLLVVWRPFRIVGLAIVAAAVALLLSGLNPAPRIVDLRVLRARVASVAASDTRSAQLRLALWKATPKMIVDNLPWGVGAKNFDKQAARYGAVGPGALPYTHAHDVPLTVAAELGLPGIAALVWILAVLARLCSRALRATDADTRALGAVLSAALVALCVDGVFDYAFGDNAFTFTVVLVFALVARVGAGARTPALPAAVPLPI